MEDYLLFVYNFDTSCDVQINFRMQHALEIIFALLYFRFSDILLCFWFTHLFIYARHQALNADHLTFVLLIGENAESRENVIASPSSAPLACHKCHSSSSSLLRLRKVVAGLRGALTRPFTSLEELIAPRAEKFMTSFHLALSYRWDGAIIARMGRYLECRKVVDGLSPLTRREEERCLRHFSIYLLTRFESWDVRLTHD